MEDGVLLRYHEALSFTWNSCTWYFKKGVFPPGAGQRVYLHKQRVYDDAQWHGRFQSGGVSALEGFLDVEPDEPFPYELHYPYPLTPVLGPEDPNFLPHGVDLRAFNTICHALDVYPDCDLTYHL